MKRILRRVKYKILDKYLLEIEAGKFGYRVATLAFIIVFGLLGSVVIGLFFIPQPWTSPFIYSGMAGSGSLALIYGAHLARIYGGGR